MTAENAIALYLKYSGNKSVDIRVALVDCDGVLYDSMKNHTRAWVMFRRGAGKNLTDEEAWEYYKVKGRYFNELGEPEMMPGAKEVLQITKEAGLRNILVTGSNQPSILERIDSDYAGLFEAERVTGIDTKNGKPNPEPYLRGQQKANAKPGECIVIENAPLGVQAGHASGSFTIGVTTGPIPEKDLYKAGADIVYPSMTALAEALPSLLEALRTTQL